MTENAKLSDPIWDAYRKEMARVQAACRSLIEDLSENQWRWQPDPSSWSILHCLAHVNRTLEAYLPRMDAAMEVGRRRGLEGRPNPDAGTRLGRWLLRTLEPPVKRRFKAPKTFQPPVELDVDSVEADFFRLRSAFAERVEHSVGLDLGRIRLASPATRLLRLSLGQAFSLISAHDRRHLWQAQNVKDRADFPGA